MNAEQQLIDSGLRAWQFNADRIESFFVPLSEEQLQQEIAPGRNRLLYLWGHQPADPAGVETVGDAALAARWRELAPSM